MPALNWSMFSTTFNELTVENAAQALGGLAPFWLNDAACSELAKLSSDYDSITDERSRQLSADLGACWIVVVSNEKHRRFLRPAMLLPLKWERSQSDDDRLPQDVLRVAREVRASLKSRQLNTDEWGLRLSPQLGSQVPNLRQLDESDPTNFAPMTAGSGWTAIAAGLLVAALDCHCDTKIWATGDWQLADNSRAGGIAHIDCLPEKIQLAHEWKAKRLFVPSTQVDEAQAIVRQLNSELEIDELKSGVSDLREALARYEDQLAIPPKRHPSEPPKEALLRMGKYFLARPTDGRPSNEWRFKADRYYSKELLPLIIDQLREQDRPVSEGCHLVTIVSGSPDVIRLTAGTLLPSRILLLYTSDKSPSGDPHAADARPKLVNELLTELKNGSHGPVDVQAAAFETSGSMWDRIPELVRAFETESGAEPQSVVFDLTPGTKEMTLVLCQRAARKGSWLTYLRHDQDEISKRAVPSTERLVFFAAGEI